MPVAEPTHHEFIPLDLTPEQRRALAAFAREQARAARGCSHQNNSISQAWEDEAFAVDAPLPAGGPIDLCLETAYGTTVRLPFQIRVF
jgi:hypothetical protein